MGQDNGPSDDVIKSYLDSVLPIDDYERPAYMDMTPVELSAIGDGMAYTDMGDDPATIKALDDAEDFDDLLSRSSVGSGPLTAENVSAKYRMSVDEAQRMIDAGAVESGGILFVNAEARDAFYTAIGGVDPSNPFADAYAAVMRDEVARADAAAALDNDIPGALFDALGDAMDDGVAGFPDNNVPEGSQYTDTELCDLLNGIPDDESYANKVNAPLTDADVADGTAGTTVAQPVRFNPNGFIECVNPDNHMPWDDHEPEHAADPMFYIWSNKHQLYWGPNRKGYVAWPSQAGRYTAVEASAIINHSMRGIILGQNRAVPDSIMLPIPDTIPDGAE